jgi:hypothetical protein
MQRLPAGRHLTAGRAHTAYHPCRHPVEKSRWHAIWLLLRADQPRTPAQVAEVVGLSVIAVRGASAAGTNTAHAGWPTAASATAPGPG